MRNHLAGTIAVDFLTVPTVTFGIVYVFFVLSLARRRLLHVNVTAHPRATWTAQQILEALDADAVPARLVRDRDGIYGAEFDARVDHLGIEQLRIAPRSPWQNGFAERWVGTALPAICHLPGNSTSCPAFQSIARQFASSVKKRGAK
jgi:transposase InsO family protein